MEHLVYFIGDQLLFKIFRLIKTVSSADPETHSKNFEMFWTLVNKFQSLFYEEPPGHRQELRLFH